MSDAETIWLALAALYLLHRAVRLPVAAAPLATWFGRWHRPVRCEAWLGNGRECVRTAPPLPTGSLIVVEPWPFSVGPLGIVAATAAAPGHRQRPPQSGTFVRWEAVRKASAENAALIVNGQPFASAASALLAERYARMLGEVAAAPAEGRGAALHARLAESLDLAAARDRFEQLRRETLVLRALGTLLVACLLGAGFAIRLASQEDPRAWPRLKWWSWGLLVLWPIALFAQRAAHRALFPTLRRARWKLLAEGLLLPPTAAAAADRVGRDALQPFHPAVVALAACRPRRARELLRRHLRDLLHPLRPLPRSDDPDAGATVEWHRLETLAAFERMLTNAGLRAAELLAPPPQESDAAGFCPRCELGYRAGIATCADCGGVPVETFAETPPIRREPPGLPASSALPP